MVLDRYGATILIDRKIRIGAHHAGNRGPIKISIQYADTLPTSGKLTGQIDCDGRFTDTTLAARYQHYILDPCYRLP